jgi:hypothetical protein
VAKVSKRGLVLDGAQSYHDGRGRKPDPNGHHSYDVCQQLVAGPHPERIGWAFVEAECVVAQVDAVRRHQRLRSQAVRIPAFVRLLNSVTGSSAINLMPIFILMRSSADRNRYWIVAKRMKPISSSPPSHGLNLCMELIRVPWHSAPGSAL